MSKKQNYRVRNWRDYNKALLNRGSLTVWFDEKSIKEWHSPEETGKRGRPKKYTDVAILCSLTLKSVFQLPLRATKGLIASLIAMLDLPIDAPDYSTLSRRQNDLEINIKQQASKGPIDLGIIAFKIKPYWGKHAK